MLSNSFSHVLTGGLPLLTGLALQGWAVLFPARRGALFLFTGAALITVAALYDRDIILFLGQVLMLPLLWLRVRSGT